MKILFCLLPILFVASCSHFAKNSVRKVSADEQCLVDEKYPRLFNIIENNQEQITVELGDFKSFYKLASAKYTYKVVFRGSKENKEDKDQLILEQSTSNTFERVVVPVAKTGVYYFTIYQNEASPLWKQKVFSIAPREKTLTSEQRETLAQQYAPVVSYHEDELYFPISIPYMINQEDPNGDLAEESFVLRNKPVIKSIFSFSSKPSFDVTFKMKDISKVLPYYGHSESVLKSALPKSSDTLLKHRYGKDHATVYYSVFENVKWKEIYINYHFFYSYDPKNGTETNDVMAAHIFDRESMTIVLRAGTLKPLSVFYGAHLASQTMAQLDLNGSVLQEWDSGRVFVNWPEVVKINDRPVPSIALGSHGIYPKAGNYAVMLNKIKLLLEPAGGRRMLYPEEMENYEKTDTSYAYKLLPLRLDNITSDCASPYGVLTYSGSTVDVLGPANASFPPYTDREEDYFTYADPNAPMFNMSK